MYVFKSTKINYVCLFFVQKHKTKQKQKCVTLLRHELGCCFTNHSFCLYLMDYMLSWGSKDVIQTSRSFILLHFETAGEIVNAWNTKDTDTDLCAVCLHRFPHIFVVPILVQYEALFPLEKREQHVTKAAQGGASTCYEESKKRKLHTTLDTTYSIVSLSYVREKAKTMVQINVTFHNIQCCCFFKYNEIKSKKKLSINTLNIIISPVIVQMKKTRAQTL